MDIPNAKELRFLAISMEFLGVEITATLDWLAAKAREAKAERGIAPPEGGDQGTEEEIEQARALRLERREQLDEVRAGLLEIESRVDIDRSLPLAEELLEHAIRLRSTWR